MTDRAETLAEHDAQLRRIVELALAEDLGEAGDITSQSVFCAGDMGAARVITREDCHISGLQAAAEVCRQVDAELAWLPLVRDGQQAPAAAEIGRLEGRLLSILAAERTLLNFVSRLSGIATLTSRYVAALEGLATRVAATRRHRRACGGWRSRPWSTAAATPTAPASTTPY